VSDPAFTIEPDGKTVTIDPADYPDEYVWYPLEGGRSVCRVHREVFERNTATKVADLPVPVFVHGMCAGCYRDQHRNPRLDELEPFERPTCWIKANGYSYQVQNSHPPVTCTHRCADELLTCTHHPHVVFDGETEACRMCVDLDNDGQTDTLATGTESECL
jgi:hypothetical protein